MKILYKGHSQLFAGILCIMLLVGILSGCGEKKAPQPIDENAAGSSDSFSPTENNELINENSIKETNERDSEYVQDMLALQRNIEQITASQTIDMDALWNNYKLILASRVNEYIFKQMACDCLIKGYDGPELQQVLDEIGTTADGMRQYFRDEVVDEELSADIAMAFLSFDPEMFDYEKYKVMDGSDVDIVSMWGKYYQDAEWPEHEAAANEQAAIMSIEWNTRTDRIGPYTISFKYPAFWDDYGFACYSDENWAYEDSLKLVYYLKGFSDKSYAETVTFWLASCPAGDELSDFSWATSRIDANRIEPLFQAQDGETGGTEYFLCVSYFDYVSYHDTKEWRRSDWGETVSRYLDAVIDSTTVLFDYAAG